MSQNISLDISPPAFAAAEELDAQRLIERLRRAEPAAVGEVYDAHHRAIRAFSRRLVGDDAVAEDLVHDVFVSLPSVVRKFRGDASMRTFLIGIAVNHARHHVRAAARRRAAMERYAETESLRRSNDAANGDLELAWALTRALDALPIKQRVAFVLCDVEGHTSSEAAAIIGTPEATVRTRVFHARKALRERLEKEGTP